MKQPQTEGLLKIGELARETGASISTIKYYVSQGLIPIEKKTSANMAYYHPGNIQRVQLIKQLQKDRFYPLQVIRELLSDNNTNIELELLSAIHKVPPEGSNTEAIPLRGAAKKFGLKQWQLNALTSEGVLEPVRIAGKWVYDAPAILLLTLVQQREDAGMPFALTLASFSIYRRALEEAVQQDVDAVIRHAILSGKRGARETAALIRLSDSTLDTFIPATRAQLNRRYGAKRVRDLAAYLAALDTFVAYIPPPAQLCPLCREAGERVQVLLQTQASMALMGGVAELSKALAFFKSPSLNSHADLPCKTYALSLQWGFLKLVPDMLDCEEAALQAYEALAACIEGGQQGQAYLTNMAQALQAAMEVIHLPPDTQQAPP